MKNKPKFILGITLSLLSLIFLIIGIVYNLIFFLISLVMLFLGIYILMSWSTKNYKWICEVCGESFEISLKENVFGINSGIYYKTLYCPKCHKKTLCKGVAK